MELPVLNDQCVRLIEERCIGRQHAVQGGLNLMVRLVAMNPPQSDQESPQALVNDEGWSMRGVDENRIRRLGTNAMDGKELVAKPLRG